MRHLLVPLGVLWMAHDSVASTPSIRFASPLQSLTIWDDVVEDSTPRSRFLPKFKAGLQAEAEMRKALKARNEKALIQLEEQGGDWARKAAALERRHRREENRLAEEAYNEAIKTFTTQQKEAMQKNGSHSPNKYQFVGVINRPSSRKPVTWHARKKPANAKWSLRLVHVNRNAIIKDLFNRGKVDVFASYKNTGKYEQETNQRIVETEYVVKECSWRTLWNFSPKHFFTDSSGMYWRERRLPPGLYTDGSMVYETSYRYTDGRNGMRRLTSLEHFLNSDSVDSTLKKKAVNSVQKVAPDIVLEE